MSPSRPHSFILRLSLFIGLVLGLCHPECTYECSDPVCRADCQPVCKAPNCSIIYPMGVSPPVIVGEILECTIFCPPDICEAEACPVCEVICIRPICEDSTNCTVECQELECQWYCVKPTDCPAPVCELQCEQAACTGDLIPTSVNSANSSLLTMDGILFILFVGFAVAILIT